MCVIFFTLKLAINKNLQKKNLQRKTNIKSKTSSGSGWSIGLDGWECWLDDCVAAKRNGTICFFNYWFNQKLKKVGVANSQNAHILLWLRLALENITTMFNNWELSDRRNLPSIAAAASSSDAVNIEGNRTNDAQIYQTAPQWMIVIIFGHWYIRWGRDYDYKEVPRIPILRLNAKACCRLVPGTRCMQLTVKSCFLSCTGELPTASLHTKTKCQMKTNLFG